MTDTTPGKDARIDALAGETDKYDGAARIIAEPGGADAYRAILEEIDTAVLASRLVFENDAGAVTLDVAGRRLNVIADAPADAVEPGQLGARLSIESPEDVKAASAVLRAFASGGETLRVRSKLVPDTDASGRAGISAKALAGAADTAESYGLLDGFLEKLGPIVTGLVVVADGKVAETEGDAERIAQLTLCAEERLDTFEASRRSRPGIHGAPSLTTWDDALTPGEGIALVIAESEQALFSYTSKDLGKIHSLWAASL